MKFGAQKSSDSDSVVWAHTLSEPKIMFFFKTKGILTTATEGIFRFGR